MKTLALHLFILINLQAAPAQTPSPPPYPVRHPAEWEEMEAVVVAWGQFNPVLREIVRHAKEEVKVYVVCEDTASMIYVQTVYFPAFGISLSNIEFLVIDHNSVWIRDYGPQCVYANGVGERYFIDWIYNRPDRPLDNLLPVPFGEQLGIPVFRTTDPPFDLVATGGNFMSDGLGTAFSSHLILNENAPGNEFGTGPHSQAGVDSLMQQYLGIGRYIKLEILEYDLIHHLDLHLKLLDEETLLVGEYPEGVADGPRIETNLQYISDNFNSAFGTPYKVLRIPMPPDNMGHYPDFPGGADFRTYANSVFVNKTILVPTYETQYDSIALCIYRQQFPGYKIVGIDCNSVVQAYGALHCISKEIGSADPLLIVHRRHPDVENNPSQGDYEIAARIEHASGIDSVEVFFTTDTASLLGYQPLPMTFSDPGTNTWTASIPHQPDGAEIFYYLRATANSGKTQVRPLPAPSAYFQFEVNHPGAVSTQTIDFQPIYPNPVRGVAVIPVSSEGQSEGSIEVFDLYGRRVEVIYEGRIPAGNSSWFLHTPGYVPGVYFVVLKTEKGIFQQVVLVN